MRLSNDTRAKRAPAKTPEGSENYLISLAVKLAESQLKEGTASAQVITHFLKLGSSKDRIEKDILERQKDLVTAKTDAIKSGRNYEELVSSAIQGMKEYSGEIND